MILKLSFLKKQKKEEAEKNGRHDVLILLADSDKRATRLFQAVW